MKNFYSRQGLAAGALISIIAGIIVLGTIVYFVGSNKVGAPETPDAKGDFTIENKKTEGDSMMKDDKMIDDKEAMPIMKDEIERAITFSGKVLAGHAAPLLDFTKTDYETALKSDKLIVLYFYANWCPICKEEVPKLEAAFNELQTSRVVGFRVNYKDSETDKDEEALAKQFGVGYQHTKVFLKNGERVLKAPDGWDKNRYLSEINKFLAN